MAPRNNGHDDQVFEGEVIGYGMPPVHIPYQRATPLPKPPRTEKRKRGMLELLGIKQNSLESDHEERMFKQYLVDRELAFRREAAVALDMKNLQTVGEAAHQGQQFVASLPFNSFAQQLCAEIVGEMGARHRLGVAKDAELFDTISTNITLEGR